MKKELIIISGFLGSGKTTFLQSLIARNAGRNIAVLINDFGKVPVDGTLLARAGVTDDVYEIAGGSVFCSCLTETLVKTMHNIAKLPVDLVLLEASGMSDPSGIDKMLKLAKLDELFDHTATFCLFDPVKSLKLAKVLEVIPRQLASASCAVLTKCDAYSKEERDTARAYIAAKEADLSVFESYHGEIVQNNISESLSDIAHRTAVKQFSFGFNTPQTRPDSVQIYALSQKISELVPYLADDCVLRVKGFVQASDGIWFLSDTGTGIEVNPADSAPVPLTIITMQGTADAWQSKFANSLTIDTTNL